MKKAERCDSYASQTLRPHLCFYKTCRLPTNSLETFLVSLHNWKNKTTGNCSAAVLFDRSGERHSAQVQASGEELLKNVTLAQEETFYQRCKTNGSVSARNLPGELYTGLVACCRRRRVVAHRSPRPPRWRPSKWQTATDASTQTWSRCGTWPSWPPASSCWVNPLKTHCTTWRRWPISPSW